MNREREKNDRGFVRNCKPEESGVTSLKYCQRNTWQPRILFPLKSLFTKK